LKEIVSQRVRRDDRLAQMTPDQQGDIALQFLRMDVGEELDLPAFEQWLNRRQKQLDLFNLPKNQI
jgi:hypothetical protein